MQNKNTAFDLAELLTSEMQVKSDKLFDVTEKLNNFAIICAFLVTGATLYDVVNGCELMWYHYFGFMAVIFLVTSLILCFLSLHMLNKKKRILNRLFNEKL